MTRRANARGALPSLTRQRAGVETRGVMKETFVVHIEQLSRTVRRPILFLTLALVSWAGMPKTAQAQWTWKSVTVDKTGVSTSIAVDAHGDVHLGYGTDDGQVKYAFRQAGVSRWDTITLSDGGVDFVSLALDATGSPHLCSTFHRLKYYAFNGTKWNVEEIAPDAANIQYSCSLGIAPDGTPHLAWYKVENADRSNYLHLKYGSLENGVWAIHTVDFDMQTGKWDSLVVDSHGVPHLAYDAFVDGLMKYAVRTADGWNVSVVDARKPDSPEYNVGMGNALLLDAQGKAHISYYTTHTLRYAVQNGDTWTVQEVDHVPEPRSWLDSRTALVLDNEGNPHIVYQDGTALKHAYWDGKQWRFQYITPPGSDAHRFPSIAIDKDDTLYVSYRDPADSSLQVAIGTPGGAPAAPASTDKKETH